MITPIKTMTINQIIARQDDLLVSADDVKAIAKNERAKVLDEFVEYVKQYMWWSTESDEKVIGEFALEEYAIAFKNVNSNK